MVHNAITAGRIKKEPCSICGYPVAQAHHEDYLKPLEIVWLCANHHGELHRRNKLI